MIDRFLLYSLEHRKKIVLMVMDEKGIRRINATVTAIGDEAVEYITARSDKKQTVMHDDILSASYARGDDGDTLKNEEDEQDG
ncbi:MAG: hypothetical protein IKW00_03160 [Clostridia bacterium]|nr:hypothetical protein [Clostridia bacterium]